MGFRRRIKILKSGKSPSTEAMKRLYNRTVLNGGVTVDFTANVEAIRDLSRKLGRDILTPIKQRNLIKWSEDFNNSIWDKGNTTVVSDSITAPNGTLTADTITSTSTGGAFVSQILLNPTSNYYTASFYIKNNNSTTSRFYIGNAVTDIDARIIWSGTTITSISNIVGVTNFIDAGNGWYKITSTFLNTDSVILFRVYPQNGVNAIGIYTWGAQLELGTTATDYQKTPLPATATFVYTPSSYGESRNYVVKPELKNLFTRSEEADDVTWSKGACSVTANSIAAPDGNVTADLLIEDVTNNRHRLQKSSQINLIGGQPYNLSAYVKKASHDWIQINPVTSSDITNYANFNLTTGTIGNTGTSGSGAIISNEGNGWYRCSIVFTPLVDESIFVGTIVSTNNINSGRYPSYTGTGASVAYPWGFQLTKGAELLPYQRTTDGIIDLQHTRATTSNVTQKDGSIGDGCYNLVTNSDPNSNTGSSNTNNITYSTYNWGINGLVNSVVFADNTVQRNRYSINITPIATCTFSFYVKMDDNSTPIIGVTTGTGDFSIVMESGVFTGTVTKTLVGNNIWRLSATRNYTSTGSNSNGVIKYAGQSSKGFIISGYQFTIGSDLKPYLKTTNRLNVPSIDYSLGKGMALIQPQRTNLVLWSEDFTQSQWSKGETTILLNSNLNPFNLNKSYYLSDTTNNTTHFLSQAISFTSGITYTVSVYVKKADHSWFKIRISESVSYWVNFNFDTGLFGNNSGTGSWAAKSLINGYWKLTLTATASTTVSGSVHFAGTNNTDNNSVISTYVGNGGKICDIAAMQLEVGSNATTYIPTTTGTFTRNGDKSFVDLWNCNMLNQNNFTLYCEGYLYNAGSAGSVFLGSSNSISNVADTIGFFSGIKGFYRASDNVQVQAGTDITNSSYYKFAIQRNGTSVKFFRNGAQMDTTRTINTANYRYIVVNDGGSTYSVSKLALLNETLSDSECVTITQLDSTSINLNTSLVAYYKLDGNTTESTGLSGNGTASNIDYVTGKTGSAARFNSVTDYIDVSDNNNFSFTDGTNDIPFTISMWVYITAFNTDFNVLMNKADGTNDEWRFYIGSTGNLLFYKATSPTVFQGIHTTASMSLNTWYMVTVTDDGSKTVAGMKLYINDVFQSSPTPFTSGTYTGMSNTNTPVRLGQYSNRTDITTVNHLGYIEEPAVWKNRVLTQAELTYLYNLNNGLTYPFS